MLYITEKEVDETLEMKETVSILREAFQDLGEGHSSVSPRERLHSDGVVLNSMPGIFAKYHLAGMKCYIAGKGGARFVVLVFDTRTSDLIAVIEANRLGQIRTGALPAMVSQLILKKKEQEIAIIGSGFQAETQLEGLLSVFDCGLVHVYSRHPENARSFARRMQSKFGVEARAHEKVGEATRNATVISSITNSNEAIFSRKDLGEKYHVNLCGGNLPMRREAAEDVLAESDIVVVENIEQALKETGEIIGFRKNYPQKEMIELKDLVIKPPSKEPDRSVLKTMGVGLEDVAAAYLVLKKLGHI